MGQAALTLPRGGPRRRHRRRRLTLASPARHPREREARKALREQEREDTRDDFQRDAIIALQDALAAYWQTMLVVHYRQIQPADRSRAGDGGLGRALRARASGVLADDRSPRQGLRR